VHIVPRSFRVITATGHSFIPLMCRGATDCDSLRKFACFSEISRLSHYEDLPGKTTTVAFPRLPALLIQIYSRTAGLLHASLAITFSAPLRCLRERVRLSPFDCEGATEAALTELPVRRSVIGFTLFSAMVRQSPILRAAGGTTMQTRSYQSKLLICPFNFLKAHECSNCSPIMVPHPEN
jgi:hypothetical protein